jgi:hypothetical protein
MVRKKEERRMISLKMHLEVLKMLKHYCFDTDQFMNDYIEDLIIKDLKNKKWWEL